MRSRGSMQRSSSCCSTRIGKSSPSPVGRRRTLVAAADRSLRGHSQALMCQQRPRVFQQHSLPQYDQGQRRGQGRALEAPWPWQSENPLTELADLLLRQSPAVSQSPRHRQGRLRDSHLLDVSRPPQRASSAADLRRGQETLNFSGPLKLRSCLRNASPPHSAPEQSRRVRWSSAIETVVAVTPSTTLRGSLGFGTWSGIERQGLPSTKRDEAKDPDLEVDFLKAALLGTSAEDSFGCSTADGEDDSEDDDPLVESEDNTDSSGEDHEDLGWSPQKSPAMAGSGMDLHATWRRPARQHRLSSAP